MELASDRGTPVIVVNPGEIPRTCAATLHLRGAAGRVLPELLGLIGV